MSNFPLVRYKATDTWIPETDIDGVDAIESVLSDVTNIDFSNGYVENASGVTETDFPTGVLAKLVLQYRLLSAKTFYHSTQGQQTVYILWKEATSDLLVYRNDTLMDMDEGNYGIIYLAKPENITYNLVNDQLKINLNVQATYITAEPVILNLTLCYLTERIYTTTIQRAEGWYLTPRWLGWKHQDGVGITVLGDSSVITEGFENAVSPFTLLTKDGWIRTEDSTNAYSGDYALKFSGGLDVFDYGNFIQITQAGASKYTFYAKSVLSVVTAGIVLKVYKPNSSNSAWVLSEEVPLTSNYAQITLNNPPYGRMRIVAVLTNYIPNPFGDPVDTYEVYIDDIKATLEDYNADESPAVVVAKYFDGQRGLVKTDDIVLGADEVIFKLDNDHIDWRIDSYEIYFTDEFDTYVRVADIKVNGQGWADLTGQVTKTSTVAISEDTLSFIYNLPATARVDNQRYIYSEITHKGRVYFVNNDYKVYQSHISTNLAIQADAFPYDEETGFGYFIVDHSKLNLALANSPTNDMVIITNQGMYVYFIQPSGSGSFKQLRMGSGNITVCALKSLTSLLNGEPASDGLFWIDYNGIYFYGGGLTAPENLITATHQRYWESLSNQDKDEAVGFYNPIRKEYWLYINQEFLIYELSFKKFKKYNTIAGITEFAGYVGLIPQYTNGSNLLTCLPSDRLAGVVSTHYNTVEANPEIYHKILQELYLEFGTSDLNAIIYMTVYADDWVVGTYIFNSNNQFEKWLSPVGVRFNRLKIRLILPANKHIKIKEFGFSYSSDINEPLAITPINIATSGYGFNYGFNY